MIKYLSHNPIKTLEAWFYGILREALGPDIYIVLGPKVLEQTEFVPESHVRISYESYYSSDNTTIHREGFVFSVSYYVTGAAHHNPHHPALDVMEKGRFALWQKVPPVPADSSPLQLRSEKIIPPEKGCGCLIAYQQIWRCTTEIAVSTTIYADPCEGAQEPGSVIPPPIDAITPFNSEWYFSLNSNYDSLQPASVGANQPWLLDTLTGLWGVNPAFNDLLPIEWGNIPVILKKYLNKIILNVTANG
jgi:hypothetical protein